MTEAQKIRPWSFQLLAALALLGLSLSSCEFIEDITKDWTDDGVASFIPTPTEVVERMLRLAQVTASDVVYDLGSGDGRIVITAAKRYGARGVGIEIDSKLVEIAREKAKEEGVSHLVEFRAGDIFAADFSPATVVTLYLTPELNSRLRPTFEKQLKAGTRVVSHDHRTDGWAPTKVETIPGGIFHDHRIYLWEIRRESKN